MLSPVVGCTGEGRREPQGHNYMYMSYPKPILQRQIRALVELPNTLYTCNQSNMYATDMYTCILVYYLL